MKLYFAKMHFLNRDYEINAISKRKKIELPDEPNESISEGLPNGPKFQ